jgi:hypothetical protein
MADQADTVAFFRVKERSVKSGPNAVSTCRDCAVSNVLIVNLLKSYRHKNASSNIADDNPVSPREGN